MINRSSAGISFISARNSDKKGLNPQRILHHHCHSCVCTLGTGAEHNNDDTRMQEIFLMTSCEYSRSKKSCLVLVAERKQVLLGDVLKSENPAAATSVGFSTIA